MQESTVAGTKSIVLKELRKQSLIVGAAICILFGAVTISIQEIKGELQKGSSATALYLVYLILLPILCSISGGSVHRRGSEQTAAETPRRGVFAEAAARLVQVIATGGIIISGLVAAWELHGRIEAYLTYALPCQLLSWAGESLDIGYLNGLSPQIHMGRILGLETEGWFRVDMFLLGIPVCLVCFSCALLFASLLSRSTAGAFAGYLTGTGISALIMHLWLRLELTPFADDTTEASPMQLPLMTLVLALTSLFIFLLALRRWSNPHRRAVRALVLGSLLCAGIATLAFFAVAYPHSIRLSPDSAYAYPFPQLTANGENVVVEAIGHDTMTPEIWAISLRGRGFTRLTGRLTYKPTLSPDGNWVAYLSQRNILGLARSAIDLRAVRIDGSQDHLLASGVADNPYLITEVSCGNLAFSPDGGKVAVVCDEKVIVAELSGARLVRTALPPDQCWHARVAWNASGAEVLITPGTAYCDGRGPLLAYNPTTGGLRTVSRYHEDRTFVFPSDTSRGTRYVLFDNSLMDVETGSVQKLSESGCWIAGISADQRILAYGIANDQWLNASEIHWRELSSGRDKLVANLRISIWQSLLVSPKGDRLAANPFPLEGPGASQAVVIDREGSLRSLEPHWTALGWVNNDEIALMKWTQSHPLLNVFPVAVVEVTTGKMRLIHP
jgi:hypothetical protein